MLLSTTSTIRMEFVSSFLLFGVNFVESNISKPDLGLARDAEKCNSLTTKSTNPLTKVIRGSNLWKQLHAKKRVKKLTTFCFRHSHLSNVFQHENTEFKNLQSFLKIGVPTTYSAFLKT